MIVRSPQMFVFPLLLLLASALPSRAGAVEYKQSPHDHQVAAAVRVVHRVLRDKYGARPSGLKWQRGERTLYLPQPQTDFGPDRKETMTRDVPPKLIIEKGRGHAYYSDVGLLARPQDHALIGKFSARSPEKVAAIINEHQVSGAAVPLPELLSRFVRANLNKPIFLGKGRNPEHPNCFGGAALFDSADTKMKFISPRGFAAHLERNYTMLERGKDLIAPGNRLVIWDLPYHSPHLRKNGQLNPFGVATPVHAATYLDANLLFSKGSTNIMVRHQLEPYSGTFTHFLEGENRDLLITVHRRKK